jgi:parallel beta-helix repeat protein
MPKSGDVLDGGDRAAILVGGKSARYAIYGDSTSHGPSDVTVRGFVIRDFNTPLQAGAIQDYNGPGWIIQNNHIIDNAAAGVATGDNVQVLGNLIAHNNQEGFSAHGNGGLYQDNEIAYNNYNLRISGDWEAGGGKAYDTIDLTFMSNYVHDNGGPGLWADTNNVNTTFDDNRVSNNWGPGIYEELSVNATIINNTVTDNGMPSSPGGGNREGWAWDAGIQLRRSGALSASAPMIISGNTVANNYNAISLIESPRSDCTKQSVAWRNSCKVQNVLVENNLITMTEGATGAYQDGSGNGIFTNQNNIFRNNHYCAASVIHPSDGHTFDWFSWLNSWQDFSTWQTYWLENAGTFTIGTCRLFAIHLRSLPGEPGGDLGQPPERVSSSEQSGDGDSVVVETDVCRPNQPRKLVTATPTPNALHSKAAICAPSNWGSKNEDARIAVTVIRQSTPTCRRVCIPRRARCQQPVTIRQYQPSQSAIHRKRPISPIRASTSSCELCGLRNGSAPLVTCVSFTR